VTDVSQPWFSHSLFASVLLGLAGGKSTGGVLPVVVGFIFTLQGARMLWRESRSPNPLKHRHDVVFLVSPLLFVVAYVIAAIDDTSDEVAGVCWDGLFVWGVVACTLHARAVRAGIVIDTAAIAFRCSGVALFLAGAFLRSEETAGLEALLAPVAAAGAVGFGTYQRDAGMRDFASTVALLLPLVVFVAVRIVLDENHDALQLGRPSGELARRKWALPGLPTMATALICMLFFHPIGPLRARIPREWFSRHAQNVATALSATCGAVFLVTPAFGSIELSTTTLVATLLIVPPVAHLWRWRILLLVWPSLAALSVLFFNLSLEEKRGGFDSLVVFGATLAGLSVGVLGLRATSAKHRWWFSWTPDDAPAGLTAADRANSWTNVCCRCATLDESAFNEAVEMSACLTLDVGLFLATWIYGAESNKEGLAELFIACLGVQAVALIVAGFAGAGVLWRRTAGLVGLTIVVFLSATLTEGLAQALLLLGGAVFSLATVGLYFVWWRALVKTRAPTSPTSVGVEGAGEPATPRLSSIAMQQPDRMRGAADQYGDADAAAAPYTLEMAAMPRREGSEALPSIRVGMTVAFRNSLDGDDEEPGIVHFVGNVGGMLGDCVGVEAFAASSSHDGVVGGRRYFQAERPNSAFFVPRDRVRLLETAASSGTRREAVALASVDRGRAGAPAGAAAVDVGDSDVHSSSAAGGLVRANCPSCGGAQMVPRGAPTVRCGMPGCGVIFMPAAVAEDDGAEGDDEGEDDKGAAARPKFLSPSAVSIVTPPGTTGTPRREADEREPAAPTTLVGVHAVGGAVTLVLRSAEPTTEMRLRLPAALHGVNAERLCASLRAAAGMEDGDDDGEASASASDRDRHASGSERPAAV